MKLINANDILEKARDVTLEGGAKHRCFDVTRLYEIPTVEAIPIDWLQEFVEWNWDYLTGPLNYILDKWKETQEWEKWKADETD